MYVRDSLQNLLSIFGTSYVSIETLAYVASFSDGLAVLPMFVHGQTLIDRAQSGPSFQF